MFPFFNCIALFCVHLLFYITVDDISVIHVYMSHYVMAHRCTAKLKKKTDLPLGFHAQTFSKDHLHDCLRADIGLFQLYTYIYSSRFMTLGLPVLLLFHAWTVIGSTPKPWADI